MKNKIFYLGILCCLFITTGSIFKIFHWPTAAIQMSLGFFVLCFLFMPMAFRSSYKTEKNKKLKFLYILVFVVFFLDFIGTLLKIMHWPGAGMAIPVTLPLIFVVLLPVYLFYNRNDKEINYNNFLAVMFFFAYFAAISALLALNIGSFMVGEMRYSSQSLDDQSNIISEYNHFIINEPKDSISTKKGLSEKNGSSNEVGAALESPKNPISSIETGSSDMVVESIESLKLKLVKIEGNYTSPPKYSGIDYSKIDKADAWIGMWLANEDAPVLKKLIEEYRESLLNKVKDEKAREQIEQLLATTSNYAPSWEYELFNGRNLILALQELNVVKYKVLIAENIALLSK